MASPMASAAPGELPATDTYCNIPRWVLDIAEREEKLYQIKHHPVEIVRGVILNGIRETVESAGGNSLLKGLCNASGESIVRHYTCAELVAGKVDIVAKQPGRLPDPWTTPLLCYDKLRMPPTHPARSPSDTYYLRSEANGELRLLRTHTSAHQMELLHAMGELLKEGVVGEEGCAITLTGDVYRKDEIDASHHVVHHQMEGLRLRRVCAGPVEGDSSHARQRAVEEAKCEADKELRTLLEGVMQHVYSGLLETDCKQDQEHTSNRQKMEELLLEAQSDLLAGKATNTAIEKRLQDAADEEDLQMLYRPHLIPYVSPGYEMDIKAVGSSGAHKVTKWLEVLGCGLIHDDVLRNAGLDPQEYVGWAYGIGLERVAMRLLGIPDIRRMWELDNPDLLQQGARMAQMIEEATKGSSWAEAWNSGVLSRERLQWDDLPYSKYPPVERAMTIKLPDSSEATETIENLLTCWNDVYELINTVARANSKANSGLHIEAVTELEQDWDKYYSDKWSSAKKQRYLARKALAERGLLKTLEIRCRSATRNLNGDEVQTLLNEVSNEVERRGGRVQ